MTAYTVYTKLRENSIESINCKRYKKRKEIKTKTNKKCTKTRVRETNTYSFVSDLRKLKNDGSVEAEVRATLDALVNDVVSAELDELLNLEAPSSEMRDLLRNFCRQYGYNYDKDFSDLQNSVLSFSVTDSPPYSQPPVQKKVKPKPITPEPEPKRKYEDPKCSPPPPHKTLKRRRKRKWDSSDDSDEQECPEILSAMMRSRSKERRNRLSKPDIRTSPAPSPPEIPKRLLRRQSTTTQFFPDTDDSDSCEPQTCKASPNSRSDSPKAYSEDDEETDCGENALSGHIFIPPLSSEDTSDEEEPFKDKPSTPAISNPNANVKSISQNDAHNEKHGFRVNETVSVADNQQTRHSPKSHAPNASSTDPWMILKHNSKEPVHISEKQPEAKVPTVNRLYGNFDVKSEVAASSKNTREDDTVKTVDNSKENEVLPKTRRPESPIKSLSVASPDLDWDSDNLVICLDPQPEDNSDGETGDRNQESRTPPVREISYKTPRFPFIDGHVQQFIKSERNDAKEREVMYPASGASSYAPLTCKVEHADAEPDAAQNSSKMSPVPPENSKENPANKSHRTPVQKVLPQVKSRSPVQHSTTSTKQPRQNGHSSAQAYAKPSPSEEPRSASRNKEQCYPTEPVTYPQISVSSVVTNSPLPLSATSPLLIQTSSPVCGPQLPTSIPSPVAIHALLNSKVSPLTVLPVVSTPNQPIPNIPVPPISISLTQSLAVQKTPLVSLFPVVESVQTIVASPDSNKSVVQSTESLSTVLPTQEITVSDISNLNTQNALDISILRSLLLDPPPEGGPNTDIHNMILQKAKELEEAEQAQDTEFNLPVITNVVSLNEEVMKQESEIKSEPAQEVNQQVSPVPKVVSPQSNEVGNRNTDSPEILEEKLKPLSHVMRTSQSVKSGLALGENLGDVVKSLQLDIKNLDKLAEEKKKEYFLIMYVRNFKRDTLRRLHESLRNKGCESPTAKRPNQNAVSTESNHTHSRETCLVRPMVQSQLHTTSIPSPKAHKATEIKPSVVPEPQKGMAVPNLISESQTKPLSCSPEVRQPPADISSIHSSLAALNKIESDYRTGFRTYLSPTNTQTHPSSYNGKDVTQKNDEIIMNSTPSGFSKYESLKTPPKTVPATSAASHSSPHLPVPSATTTSPSLVSSILSPSTVPSPGNLGQGIASWKGTVSAYLQKTKTGKAPYPSGGSVVPPPPYTNTVKNLLKQSTTPAPNCGLGAVPSIAKEFSKGVENGAAARPQGPTHLNGPPFLDFYPFQALAAANNYLQTTPFWPASIPPNKQNSSLASLQAARDFYMNSLTFGAWRTAKCAEMESERLGEKSSSEKLWNPVAASAGRPYLSESQDTAQNLSTHRPFHYGTLRKCVVCKVADAQFICSGCGKDWYCSVACQRQNWRVHSRNCVSQST